VSDAQAREFPDASFDTVICTLALCTIPDDRAAVSEAKRVLRPGGRFLLLEHVGSPVPPVRLGQRLLEPLMLRFEGDHLLLEPLEHLRAEEFDIERLRRWRAAGCSFADNTQTWTMRTNTSHLLETTDVVAPRLKQKRTARRGGRLVGCQGRGDLRVARDCALIPEGLRPNDLIAPARHPRGADRFRSGPAATTARSRLRASGSPHRRSRKSPRRDRPAPRNGGSRRLASPLSGRQPAPLCGSLRQAKMAEP
jgi:hypothetical protein